MKIGDWMPVLTGALALGFSIASWFAHRRYGTRVLWKAAAGEFLVAMALLWTVGWAQTSESPLVVSILMVSTAVCAINVIIHALAHLHPIMRILSAGVAGVIGSYAGIIIAFIVLVYIT